MRKSSKMLLLIAGILAFVLAAVYIPLFITSRPEFTESDAREMLTGLAKSLQNESADKAVSYAWEDANVAGQTIKVIHEKLRSAFSFVRHLGVSFGDLRHDRKSADTVILRANAIGAEVDPQSGKITQTYYSNPVVITVTRRGEPQLVGLFTTYEWKIENVEAPGLPSPLGPGS